MPDTDVALVTKLIHMIGATYDEYVKSILPRVASRDTAAGVKLIHSSLITPESENSINKKTLRRLQ